MHKCDGCEHPDAVKVQITEVKSVSGNIVKSPRCIFCQKRSNELGPFNNVQDLARLICFGFNELTSLRTTQNEE